MSHKTTYIWTIAAAVAIVSLVLTISDHQNHIVDKPATAEPVIILPPPVRKMNDEYSRGIAVPMEAQMSSSGRVSARLQLDFVAARDWRTFAINALDRPGEGGYFYAMHATELCGRDMKGLQEAARQVVISTIASSGTVSPAALNAVDRLSASCASFAPGEAVEMYRLAKSKAVDNRDPLINATQAVTNALASKEHRNLKQTVQSLLVIGDPLAISNARLIDRVMAANVGPDRQDGDIWFNGETYGPKNNIEYTALMLALQVATCEPLTPCALDDQLMLACISGGSCSMDRQEYLTSQLVLAGSEAPTLESVNEKVEIMKLALASGNASAFVK